MKYLFAIDLDGTLLNDEAKLTPKTIKYLRKLDDEYKIIITTGRPYQGMIEYYNMLGLKTLAICNSGTSVVLPNDKSFISIEHPIDKEIFISFFKASKHCIDSGIYNIKERCYIYNRRHDNEFLKHVAKNSQIIEGPFDKTCDTSPNGALLIIKPTKEKEFEGIVRSYDILDCRSWGNFYGNDFYEVHQKKYNKATSLLEVIKYYNATKEQLVCIGDSLNDTEMLNMTDNSVAMKNAMEEVKVNAKYITEYDNNNDGVIRFINKFIKIKNGLK